MSDKPSVRRPPKEPLPDVLRAAALAYLERFPASAARTRQVLERRIRRYCAQVQDADSRGYAEAIDPLIDTLRAAGYIDDAAYARGLRSSFARKGVPVRVAAQKMRLKGLEPELVDALCWEDGVGGAEDFLCALRFARRKKLGPFSPPAGGKPPEKALAMFARAGFDYETAALVMKTDPDHAERSLEGDPP